MNMNNMSTSLSTSDGTRPYDVCSSSAPASRNGPGGVASSLVSATEEEEEEKEEDLGSKSESKDEGEGRKEASDAASGITRRLSPPAPALPPALRPPRVLPVLPVVLPAILPAVSGLAAGSATEALNGTRTKEEEEELELKELNEGGNINVSRTEQDKGVRNDQTMPSAKLETGGGGGGGGGGGPGSVSSAGAGAGANSPQPANRKAESPLASSLKPTSPLNLPPIRLASAVPVVLPYRAASLDPSPSPLSSSSLSLSSSSSSVVSAPSPSVLPSFEEPHPPALRGTVAATDNTTIPPAAKRCPSSPSPPPPAAHPSLFPRSRAASPAAPASPASSITGPSLLPLLGLASCAISSSSIPSIPSSQAAIDNDEAALRTVGPRLPPLAAGPSTYTDSRTASRKRSLEEYQGTAPAPPSHPLSQSLTADSIPNQPLPSAAGAVDVPLASVTHQPFPASSSIHNKLVPLRLHEHDLPNRADIDNSVESTIVLAHRAVTAIKSQTLPQPRTIGPTFTIGKPGSHHFGVTRKSHDGVMESEDESDNESITNNAACPSSSARKPRMMPWDRRVVRDDSPDVLERGFDEDLPTEPLWGAKPLPPSSPKLRRSLHGMRALIESLGGSNPISEHIVDKFRSELNESTDNNNEQKTNPANGASNGESVADSNNEKPSSSSANPGSHTISPISRSGDGGSGDGGEDPNKRSRKLSEHEEDNGVDFEDSGRTKRRKLDQLEEEGHAEPQFAGQSDRDVAASSLFGLSKGPSPPPVPSGPPTVESVPSTAPTMDSAPAYSETAGTPATICDTRSEYHKSPIENTTSNVLPPISVGISPGRSPMSPRTSQHTTLPGVNSLFTVASAAEKHSMEHQQLQSNHVPSTGKFVKAIPIQNLKIPAPPSSQNSTSNPRNYVDDYSRAIPFNDPAQQYRTMTPQSRQSPTVSPTENRNAPIAPAPPNFSGKASTSPLTQFTQITPSYYPPRNLGRPEHHATLPQIQTDWPGSLPPSEPNSARTPTSKTSKRGRNGTPKHGSIDSSQSSPSVPGGFKCTKEGCTAAPFSTQYLLNSHANVHSEERPHFCPVAGCSRGEGGKGFKRKNEMIRHGLVHQSPGYVCPFCPDKEHRYPRPDNLQRHVKAHHKDKNGDDPLLREVLAVRPEGGQRGRRRRLGPST
ncbi:hypothetical protein H072_9259 [Dactylellina haptotyla CBS 200.50]|uniref:C2H2-type domain-containing protein n=1 Tax=Dactylellina haptotyla (strain CBS 200.50) TaxID=1284197 RepID=S8A7L8_DACHA|nr:hypothetical protein H072_9259 [Dactylellina haptotyla CBS 200.50]